MISKNLKKCSKLNVSRVFKTLCHPTVIDTLKFEALGILNE